MKRVSRSAEFRNTGILPVRPAGVSPVVSFFDSTGETPVIHTGRMPVLL